MNQARNSRHTYFQSPAELLIHPAPWGREDGGGNVTLWQESCDRQPSQQLRLGDGSWSPDPTDGPCGLAIDLKRREKKKKGNCFTLALLMLRGQICLLAALPLTG